MLFLFDITDDQPLEYFDSRGKNAFWHGDFIQVFLSQKRGSDDIQAIAIVPGVSNDKGEVSIQYKYPKNRQKRLYSQTALRKKDKGYCLELLLPWQNLNRTAVEVGARPG